VVASEGSARVVGEAMNTTLTGFLVSRPVESAHAATVRIGITT
jgi:hypothetical protein